MIPTAGFYYSIESGPPKMLDAIAHREHQGADDRSIPPRISKSTPFSDLAGSAPSTSMRSMKLLRLLSHVTSFLPPCSLSILAAWRGGLVDR